MQHFLFSYKNMQLEANQAKYAKYGLGKKTPTRAQILVKGYQLNLPLKRVELKRTIDGMLKYLLTDKLIVGATRKVLMRKVLMRKVQLLENPKTVGLPEPSHSIQNYVLCALTPAVGCEYNS